MSGLCWLTVAGLLRLQQIYQSLKPGSDSFQVETVKRIQNVSEALDFLHSLEELDRYPRLITFVVFLSLKPATHVQFELSVITAQLNLYVSGRPKGSLLCFYKLIEDSWVILLNRAFLSSV